MRFCHLTTFYPPWSYGGDGILVQQICESLVRRGHQVDVVHCRDAARLKQKRTRFEPNDPPGLRRHILRSGWGFLSPLITQQTGRPGLKQRSLQEILSEPYDVVHFHNLSLVGGLGALKLSQAPVTLYTLHDHWLVCPAHVLWKFRRRPCDGPQCIRCSLINGIPPQLWRYTRWPNRCLENVDALLAQSHFSAEVHRQAGISQPIRVLPAFSRPLPLSDAPDYRSARPLFAYAGRVEPSKGIEDLVRAFRKRPQYDLVVAGAGSLLAKLQAEYEDCPHIRFLGSVSHGEVAALFAASMAVISPTWGPEAFLLVNAEAMACGTPVIGRRAGGSVESIERTGGGLIYEQPEELLPLVDRMASNSTLRAELADLAAKGYRDHFSEARWMEQYFETIKEIGDAKGVGTR